MLDFTDAINQVLTDEGSRIVIDDKGRGASKFGITLETAQQFYPDWTTENIEDLTPDDARNFYANTWIPHYHLDLLTDQDVAFKVFNLSVNVPSLAIRWLQQTVGVNVDGIIGPETAAAANSANPALVLTGIRLRAKTYYQNLPSPKYDDVRAGLIIRAES